MLYANLPSFLLGTSGGLPTEFSFWLAGPMMLGPVGMYLGIVALGHAPAAAIAPYIYSRLPIAAVLGCLLFVEWPDSLSLAGASIIFASYLLSIRSGVARPNVSLSGEPKPVRTGPLIQTPKTPASR
jgi:drug/metabolite transporter (DMT)-like permease